VVIWITGLAGSGKTTLVNLALDKVKDLIGPTLHIDGDEFRKCFGNDLGYSLKDRNTNAVRLINFIEYIESQNINVICSANLTSPQYRELARQKFKKFYEVFIKVEIETLHKRKPEIYVKSKTKESPVAGLEIKFEDPKSADLILENDHKSTTTELKYNFLTNLQNWIKKNDIY
tara:strand:- start:138 stop:659 length:522 start_codon:yes stop_codon:yes gene_type:complete